ncbi:hypothetical protein [Shewanella waksmanii]|uniref:hypothetical protein n=1 Tax=Shewanella waksmanii TaxID=213783 RepID=UPI003735FC83
MSKGSPFKGVVRFWLFDVGSASFLGVSLMALVLMLIAPVLAPAKIENFAVMLSMLQVSTATAIAWQLMRLSATEWADLVPDYRRNIIIQSIVLALISTLLCIGLAWFWQLPLFVTELMLASLLGLGFISLTLIRPASFHLSFLLFVCLVFLSDLALVLNENNHILLMLLSIMLLLVAWQLRRQVWHSQARSVYQNGLEMGWFWLPNMGNAKLLAKLESYLHPLSFFVGPLLSIMLIGLPVLTLLAAVVMTAMGINMPVLFLLSQFICVLCAIVHWCRIQRWRGVETLYLLPGFDGKQGMIDLFIRSQNRLIGLIIISMAVTAALVGLLNETMSFAMWLHVVLTTFIGSGLLLGLGCMSSRVLHISLAMFAVVVYSGYLSYSMSQMSAEQGNLFWLIIDVVLLLPACLTLWIGKKKLWSGDLL